MGLISKPVLSRSEQQAKAFHDKKSPKVEPELSRLRKFQKASEPGYKKAVGVVEQVARKGDKVLKYATSSPKVKHSRNLPWRL